MQAWFAHSSEDASLLASWPFRLLPKELEAENGCL
jgi:hypothetical protein